MKSLIGKRLLFILVFSLLLTYFFQGGQVKNILADTCSNGAVCAPYVMWDRPSGCNRREVEVYDDGGTLINKYYYFWQAYVTEPRACLSGTNCGWSSTGQVCNGGDWLTGEAYTTSDVPFSGGCCGGDISGGGDPCQLVSGDGCYGPNCPEWGTGHGLGSNGCAANQYYCTGSYWTGNCCSVSSWSACSVSCGGGVSTNNCGGTTPCNTQTCCVSTTWGACSAACGGGTQVSNCGTSRACNTEQCNWWQVKDSDVSTNGDLISKVPTSLYFGLVGDGGFPGVPAFSGATRFTTSNVSVEGWFANTGVTAANGFGSNYFINKIPPDATINTVSDSSVDGSYFESGGSSYNGYYWYVYDGASTGTDLNIISGMSLGSRKVILIVKDANLNLGGNINLTKGSGFFLGVTSGNIVVGTTVGGGGNNLEGIYVADGTFSTGATNIQLIVRGTVVGYGGITLQRDLGAVTNETTPGELFEYAPDQELLFPVSLAYRLMHWREVAP